MHFADFSSFLAMGGYGLYVWLSFAAALISLVLVWGDAWLSKKRLFKQIIQEEHRQVRINAAKQAQNTDGEK